MLELLGTYSDEDAPQARDDAHRCIVTCVGDKKTFLLDHLLLLKPVKFLEGELIHDLLVIFVSGTLQVCSVVIPASVFTVADWRLTRYERIHHRPTARLLLHRV